MKRWMPVLLAVAGAVIVAALIVWGLAVAREAPMEAVVIEPALESPAANSCTTDVAPEALTDAPNPADYLTYTPSAAPITEPVTKMGGQPVWIDRPQWPLNALTGQPMVFVGQIAIDPELFPGAVGRMAYIFIASDFDEIVAPWDPNSGENAVIIQPSTAPPPVDVMNAVTGPTVPSDVDGAVEFGVTTDRHLDDALVPLIDLVELPEEEMVAYQRRLVGDKIGGTPTFIQNDEFPSCEPGYSLLWQVEAPPVWINLGDGGVGFAYLDATGERGRFLYQSH